MIQRYQFVPNEWLGPRESPEDISWVNKTQTL